MSTITPLTPAEVKAKAIESIPSEMIQAVNELLIENASRHSITIHTKDIITRFRKLANGKYDHVANVSEKGWLDFEPLFRNAGWSISFNSPDRGESFESYFRFNYK